VPSAMSVERRAYLDTSALAKWYLEESNSNEFVAYLRTLDVAVISSLTVVEMRSLLSRRRRRGEITTEDEAVLFAALLDDLARGWLQRYPMEDSRFDEAANLLTRYPESQLRTLDALHLVQAAHAGARTVATADIVMANAAIKMGFDVARF
jgi:predicted nucleic acid-binding protein